MFKVDGSYVTKVLYRSWNKQVKNDSTGGDNQRAFTSHWKK